jgi:ABC-type antimicrobial peptide transport system permease subunit
VLFAAFNNIYPVIKSRIWLVTFLFGLIHGFGFASVLMDLGLKQTNLVTSLLGFNLGVEIGQFFIVIFVLPVIYSLRNSFIYQKIIFKLLSVIICLVALIWLVERVFDWKIFTVR